MSSKKFTLSVILVCLFFGITSNASAQLTQPYLVKEALPNIKKVTSDSGWVNPFITVIATIGDTAGLGESGGLLGGAFDMKTGRSPLWIYVVSITDANGNPQSKIVAFIKVPFLGLQQFPIPDDVVSPVLFFEEFIDSLPVSTMLNSDAITNAIKANKLYQDFSTAHPKAKSSFIVLVSNPFEFPGSPFTEGSPLWSFTFEDESDSLSPTMQCAVHAVTGETFCFDPETLVSVNDEIIQESSLRLLSHPIAHGMNGILTFPVISGNAQIEIMDLFGRIVFSNDQLQIGTTSITLPQLLPGVYVARLNQEGTYSSIRFIQQ
jgi:hypothetical protein